jgi:hypothetical protein
MKNWNEADGSPVPLCDLDRRRRCRQLLPMLEARHSRLVRPGSSNVAPGCPRVRQTVIPYPCARLLPEHSDESHRIGA